MKIKRSLLFVILMSLISQSVYSQKYSTKSKSAIEHYQKATTFLQVRDYVRTFEELKESLGADKKFIEAWLLTAEAYHEMHEYEKEAEAFERAISINDTFFPRAYLSLAGAYILTGEYQKAIDRMNSFQKFEKESFKYAKLIDLRTKKCEFALKLKANPVEFSPKNVGSNVNSKYDEYLPAISLDEQNLIITRRYPTDTSNFRKTVTEDFFISKRNADKTWGLAENIGPPINTSGNEGAQTLSVDGSFFIFTKCTCPDGIDRCCDLYISRKGGDQWSAPTSLGSVVNSSDWDSQPTFSSDGKTLIFVSSREGGKGKRDLWITEWREDGSWTIPVNLGDSINTDGEEISPCLHPDNKTLYFTSDGHWGMGGLDIFVARKNEEGKWTKPVNLGYPINTHRDESSLIVTPSGEIAFFASDKLQGVGGYDIYEFLLPEIYRPSKVNYLKGIIYDAVTKKKISANFELIELITAQTVVKSISDQITGSFLVAIPGNKNYALNVSKPGYLFHSESFLLRDSSDNMNPYTKEIYLQPIEKGKKFVLKNIFFEYAKYDIKPESFGELNKLYDFMVKNQDLKIEIGGHTDKIGTEEYNFDLSKNRAKSVCEYLIKKGIMANRLAYKGYGYSQPIASNENETGRAQNRRTEIKILE